MAQATLDAASAHASQYWLDGWGQDGSVFG
jgi:hypothetical protein